MKRLFILGLLIALASAATADASQRIEDRARETRALKENGRVDIIRASSARYGSDVRFTVTMRNAVRPNAAEGRPLLIVNVRGGARSDPEYLLLGATLFRVKRSGDDVPIGNVRAVARGRTWSYRFNPDQIRGGLDRYGWAALTRTGDASDVAPEDGYVSARA